MSNIKLLYFSAPWCGPCKMLKPIIQQFADKHPECEVISINVEEDEEATKNYNCNSIPTCIFVKNEKEVSRFSGSKSLVHLENLLDEAII